MGVGSRHLRRKEDFSLLRQRGFTLVEAVVTMVVVGILITAGVPGLVSLIKNNRLATDSNDFVTALYLARSEAVKRNTRITLCKSSDGSACASTGSWEMGWIVFVDDDADGSKDVGEELLRVHDALAGTTTLRGEASVASYVSYLPSGEVTSNGKFSLCDDRDFMEKTRGIDISVTGRVRRGLATEVGVTSCTPS